MKKDEGHLNGAPLAMTRASGGIRESDEHPKRL